MDVVETILQTALADLGYAVLWTILVLIVYWSGVRLVKRLEKKGTLSEYLTLVCVRVMRWIAVAASIIAVLHAFGVLENVRTLLATTLGLVAVGFVAVWSVLSNFLCSLMLMVSRPFEAGDVVELPAQSLQGKVVNFNLLFTILRDDDGSLIQIPNNTFFQTPIRRKPGKSTVDLQDQLRETEDVE